MKDVSTQKREHALETVASSGVVKCDSGPCNSSTPSTHNSPDVLSRQWLAPGLFRFAFLRCGLVDLYLRFSNLLLGRCSSGRRRRCRSRCNFFRIRAQLGELLDVFKIARSLPSGVPFLPQDQSKFLLLPFTFNFLVAFCLLLGCLLRGSQLFEIYLLNLLLPLKITLDLERGRYR